MIARTLSRLAILGLIGVLLCAPAKARKTGSDVASGEPGAAAASPASVDARAYMHGVGSATGPEGVTYVFFSSSGLPPRGPDRSRNWTHDVYVAQWTHDSPMLSKPRLLIAEKEAQEPVSVAQNAAGNIMLTFEDGSDTVNTVSQRYRLYDWRLQPRNSKSVDVWAGGHSGHVAAVGYTFVVFYSDDWVDGGGVDNLGTGKGVYIKTFDSKGRLLRTDDVAPKRREWWPLIAGSDTVALLVWQEYIPGATHARLKVAIYRPADGRLFGTQVLSERLKYYTYGVAYVPALDSFLVVGTTDADTGFAKLVASDGQVRAALDCMPATVREAGITVIGNVAFTPAQDGRLLHLTLSAGSISLRGSQPSPIPWTIEGSVGLARSRTALHWVSLTQRGLQEADMDINEARPPSDADLCR